MLWLLLASSAEAQGHHGSGGSWGKQGYGVMPHGFHRPIGPVRHDYPLVVGSYPAFSWYGVPYGFYPIAPPYYAVAPGVWFPPALLSFPPLGVAFTGLAGASPAAPARIFPATFTNVSGVAARPVRRADPAQAQEKMTFGDRFFRAGSLIRAAERYDQASRATPDAAAPRVRQAQVAFVRGRYSEAAELFRMAETLEPGWLTRASDIQRIYGEPADFAKQLSKLESHLQAHPDDRDAWLVLGAELFLSGRVRKAADIFLRLSDRKADPTLAAFLDATKANKN
jgi:hypothetical protein